MNIERDVHSRREISFDKILIHTHLISWCRFFIRLGLCLHLVTQRFPFVVFVSVYVCTVSARCLQMLSGHHKFPCLFSFSFWCWITSIIHINTLIKVCCTNYFTVILPCKCFAYITLYILIPSSSLLSSNLCALCYLRSDLFLYAICNASCRCCTTISESIHFLLVVLTDAPVLHK